MNDLIKSDGIERKIVDGKIFRKKDNLQKAVGIHAKEANKMDFFDLMGNLPQDIKRNIGKKVKGDIIANRPKSYKQEQAAFGMSFKNFLDSAEDVSGILAEVFDAWADKHVRHHDHTGNAMEMPSEEYYSDYHRSIKELLDFEMDDDVETYEEFIDQLNYDSSHLKDSMYGIETNLPDNFGRIFDSHFKKNKRLKNLYTVIPYKRDMPPNMEDFYLNLSYEEEGEYE